MKRLLAGILCAGITVAITPSAPVNIGAGNEGVEILRRGNEAYLAGRVSGAGWTVERRKEVALGQHPFAVILTCADSRVPPEVI